MSKGIIVLGMHRSGTSLVANLAQLCGAYAGDESLLLQADSGNPAGYFEYRPLVNFNETLLASAKATWIAPPLERDALILERLADEPKYREQALELIETMEAGGDLWFWKDPRLAILLPFWKRIWRDVVYVIPVRNPLDTALSLRKRNVFPVSASLLLWQRYMMSILTHTEDSADKLFVEYEEVIKNPVEECKRLLLFISNNQEDDEALERKVDAVAEAVRPDLRRNKSGTSFFDLQQATAAQKSLYRFLKSKLNNPAESFNPDEFVEYSGWREYMLTLDMSRKLWGYVPDNKRLLAATELARTHREFFGA